MTNIENNKTLISINENDNITKTYILSKNETKIIKKNDIRHTKDRIRYNKSET